VGDFNKELAGYLGGRRDVVRLSIAMLDLDDSFQQHEKLQKLYSDCGELGLFSRVISLENARCFVNSMSRDHLPFDQTVCLHF